LAKAVANFIHDRPKTPREWLETALSVIGISAGIIAAGAVAVGTGGAGAAAAGIAFRAALVSAGSSLGQLLLDVDKGLGQAAAENVSLDKDLADLREGDPEIFPLVMDMIGAGADIAAALAAAKALRIALAELKSGKKSADEFVKDAVSAGAREEAATRVASQIAGDEEITQIVL